MKYNEYELEAIVWRYAGAAGWHFITIPQDISEDIKHEFGFMKRGWGSLPVRAKINNTVWETSIFPDKKLNGYLLPVKAEVRNKEEIVANKKVKLFLEIKK